MVAQKVEEGSTVTDLPPCETNFTICSRVCEVKKKEIGLRTTWGTKTTPQVQYIYSTSGARGYATQW